MQFDFRKVAEDIQKEYPNCMMLSALQQTSSPLALQQSDYKHPQLPVMDRMNNKISFVALSKQISIFQEISITQN